MSGSGSGRRIYRTRPSHVFIVWKPLASLGLLHFCDSCNEELDLDPVPTVDHPSEEDEARGTYKPRGDRAYCRRCALEYYGITGHSGRQIEELWVCLEEDDVLQ